ncbi:MAG: hypothetical protein AB1806_15700 [Acidobacteriota bacterium]
MRLAGTWYRLRGGTVAMVSWCRRISVRCAWFAGLVMAVVAMYLAGARTEAQGEIPVRWEGDLTVVYFAPPPPTATGAITTTWQMRVRWNERRIDVKDDTGRLTGQIVVLADDGSRWNARAEGQWFLPPITTTASGTGSGTSTIGGGWVYFSLVDDDPLADVLPNGSYHFWGPGTVEWSATHTHSGGAFTASGRVPMRLAFNVSNYVWALAPNWSGESLSAEGLRAELLREAPFTERGLGGSDGEKRTLVDGAMVGHYDWPPEGGPILQWQVSWNVHRRLALDTTLDPVDAAWRPKLVNTVTLGASIDEAQGVTGKFRFTLFEVSREKGYALNAGGSGTGLDLRFASEQPAAFAAPTETADGWVIEATESLSRAQVAVASMDYGAWGKLKADVNVDGEWYECQTSDGKAYVTIPADGNENRIWDTWERNAGVWDADPASDTDEEPAGASAGDGFSNFEEYRGFMAGGTWVSLDPRTKELFVYDEIGQGIGYFGQSGVISFVVDQDELDADRVANFNRGYASAGRQKGLHLVDSVLDPGTVGLVEPNVGTPNTVTRVMVDTAQLAGFVTTALPSTIAHELGHAVGVHHHGDWGHGSCSGGPAGVIAYWAGAHAGDQACVMSYSGAKYYRGWDRQCYVYTWTPVWGSSFCVSKTGTGINAGSRRMEDGRPLPVSGDGTRGDCVHAIRLK